MQLISALNNCFSHCPRPELMGRVLETLGKCKGILKKLAVARNRLKFSKWESISKKSTHFMFRQPHSKTLWDIWCQSSKSNWSLLPQVQKSSLFGTCTTRLSSPLSIETAIRRSSLGRRSDLGAITPLYCYHSTFFSPKAAATMGCKSLWLRATEDFLASGGEESWVKEGLSAVPPLLRKIGRLSGYIAYNIRQLVENNCFG